MTVLTTFLGACGGNDDDDKSASATTTTVDPKVLAADAKKIQDLITYTNAAYQASAEAGMRTSASVNYDVWTKDATLDECLAFVRKSLGYLVASQFQVTLDEGTILPAGEKTRASLKGTKGRLYDVKLNVSITIPNRPEPVVVDQVPSAYVIVKDGTAKRVGHCKPRAARSTAE